MSERGRRESAHFWIDPALGPLEVLHARYRRQSFAPHTHDTYALAVVEHGAGSFRYRGATHVAPAGALVVIHPGELHTGEASAREGWSYRILYPATDLVARAVGELTGRPCGVPFFPSPVIDDADLVARLRGLHHALASPATSLERESRLLEALALFAARHAEERALPRAARPEHRAARRLREYLEAHHRRNVTLGELARVAGMSPFHLVRVFRATTGLPPHAYLAQVRVRRAARLLGAGWPIARAALDAGFVDQSHLTKHFRRVVGVTPGAYRRSLGERVDRPPTAAPSGHARLPGRAR